MEHLSNDYKDCPNQQKNSHKLYDEMRHPVLNLTESQWKLRQQHDQILLSEDRNKSKRARPKVTVRDLSRKVNHQSKVI